MDEIRKRLKRAESAKFPYGPDNDFGIMEANAPADLSYLLARVEKLEGLLATLIAAADNDDGYGDEFVVLLDDARAALGEP